MTRKSLETWLLRGSLVSAILPILLGATVLVGWYARLEILIQIHSEFVPMQFNTALGFFLIGGALLAKICGKMRLAQVLAGAVAILGLLTLAEYVFSFDIGIDELFMKHYITVATSHPGRMAPNTALGFFLSGMAIVVTARGDCGAMRNQCFGIAGSIVIGLGFIAFFGYVSGIPGAYGWGRLTQMAVHTSLGFIVVGSGLSLKAIHDGLADGERSLSWLPTFFGLGTLTATIAMWQALNAELVQTESILPTIVLGVGLFSAVLLSVSTRLSQVSRAQADKLEHANESLKLWELAFEHAQWGIMISDASSSELLSANAAFARMHGYNQGEIGPVELEQIFSLEDHAVRSGRMQRVHDRGHFEYESTHRKKDGSSFPVLSNVVAIYDDNGSVLYRATNLQDITERKKTKEALLFTQFAVDEFSDPIYWVRKDGRIRYANNAACQTLGYSKMELESMAVSEIDKDFPIEAWPLHWQEMKDSGSFSFLAHHVKQSGEVFPVEIHTSYMDYEGVEYIWASARDITSLKKIEDETTRLNTVVAQSPVTMYITNLDGTIIYANPYSELSTGYEISELMGKNPRLLKSGLHKAAFYKDLWGTITSGDTWSGILTNKRKDGTLYHEDATIFPITDQSGQTINYATVNRDITAQVRLNEERDRLLLKVREQAKLERENQHTIQQQDRLAVVGQLASGIAHDFNNFMAVILLYSEMLLKAENLSTSTKKGLDIILQQAREATDLTQQILDFARLSALKRESLDMREFLEGVTELLIHTIPENIVTTLTIGVDENVVSADRTRLKQVIMNLALNARDSMPEGGTLQITLDRIVAGDDEELLKSGITPGEWAHLKVIDSGSGISSEHIEHVFEPFFTTKPAGKGTGLGLAQVYGIMKQHGGFVDVQSIEGSGTAFSCFLPISAVSGLAEGSVVVQKENRGEGRTVLLVEDKSVLRGALAKTLELLDYKVIEAESGAHALTILDNEARDIDLVLSDLIMPEMGGRNLLLEMRKRDLNIPFVILSGHPLEEELEELQASGLSGWMTKPPDPTELGKLIAEVLNA